MICPVATVFTLFASPVVSLILLSRHQVFPSFTRRAILGCKNNKTVLSMNSKIIGKSFVSIEEGIQAINEETIFVDGSWWLGKVRDARGEYEAGPRIAGAKFFDIDDVAERDKTSNPKGLPHMAPSKVEYRDVLFEDEYFHHSFFYHNNSTRP